MAPKSGVVVERVLPLKSSRMSLTGVPRLSRASLLGTRVLSESNTGSRFTELVPSPVAWYWANVL